MDAFCEYIIKKKRGNKEIGIIALSIVGALILSFLIMTYLLSLIMTYVQPLSSLVLPLVIGVWYGAYIVIKRQNIEFEYALTSGELDVDKIMNRSRRARLLSVSVRSFEAIALVSSGQYNDAVKALPTIDASSAQSSPATYFAVYTKDGQRKCLLFEPPGRMLEAMRYYIPDKLTLPAE